MGLSSLDLDSCRGKMLEGTSIPGEKKEVTIMYVIDGSSTRKIIGDIFDEYLRKFHWYSCIRTIHSEGFKANGFVVSVYDFPGVDKAINSVYRIGGKVVGLKRTVFVGGIPRSMGEDDFKRYFSEHGTIIEHEIVRKHGTRKSCGYGFLIFDSLKAVDTLVKKAKRGEIKIEGSSKKIKIKKIEVRKYRRPAHPLEFDFEEEEEDDLSESDSESANGCGEDSAGACKEDPKIASSCSASSGV